MEARFRTQDLTSISRPAHQGQHMHVVRVVSGITLSGILGQNLPSKSDIKLSIHRNKEFLIRLRIDHMLT